MGGTHAIEQMKKLCESKECKVIDTAIINMKNKKHDQMIADAVEKLSCIKSAKVL
ncbi:MAG: hypothetical protein AB7V48_05430 [Sedimentibacter sp.]